MSSVVETCEASPMPPTPQVVSKEVPTNQNVPDNYVSWTLKNQKPLPPITLATLFENVEWPTFIVLVLTPSLALYGLFTVHMQWKTFVWSVAYYFFTGLGMSLHFSTISSTGMLKRSMRRYHCRVPSTMGAQVVQRIEAAPIFSRSRRHGCRRGLDQVVVP